MGETRSEQRHRILRDHPDIDPRDYDNCVDFGYEPESWDGMWLLRQRVPIIRLSKNWAVAFEATKHVWRNRVVFRPRLARRVASD